MFVSETNLPTKIFAFDARRATGGRDRRDILRTSAMTQPGAKQNIPMKKQHWHKSTSWEESTGEREDCLFDPHHYSSVHRINDEFVDGSR